MSLERCKNIAEKEHERKWGEVSPEKAPVPPEENAIEIISGLLNDCARESYWCIKHTIW